jgi:hypothetical protein
MREMHLTSYWCLSYCANTRLFKHFLKSKYADLGRRNDTLPYEAMCPFGAHGARETPVPMPNTAVKPRRGYNTWGSPLGK